MISSDIQSIDMDRRLVITDTSELAYDALVIALGADLAPARVPGLQEALLAGQAEQFYTLEGAETLHRKLGDLHQGRLVVLVAGVPFKCPAAPFEGAFLAADLLRSGEARDRVRIDTFTPDPFPMPVAGPAVGKALVDMLGQYDIGFHPNKTIERIEGDARELVFADGTREGFDLLAVVPPHQAPASVIATGLGPAGWIPVNARTLATPADGIWAIGDVTILTLPNGKPLPKAAVFAEGEAEVVASGVARYLGYDAPDPWFTGFGSCYIELGDHQAAKGEGNFLDPPAPAVSLYEPSADFHREKHAQETDWLKRWNA